MLTLCYINLDSYYNNIKQNINCIQNNVFDVIVNIQKQRCMVASVVCEARTAHKQGASISPIKRVSLEHPVASL